MVDLLMFFDRNKKLSTYDHFHESYFFIFPNSFYFLLQPAYEAGNQPAIL